ncbi:DUF2793 domain-containing protein [Cupriavidus gilardii]|nr:DUF2793 domain-containing protein [Cupriavidus gilardii]MCT9070798.1 DUF2793 domain-containing protein [Cupriavidus gilardii]
MDANLKLLDAVLQLSVKSRAQATPPATPANGDRYIVAANPTGAWVGKAGQIAVRIDAGWTEADQALWAGVLNFWFLGRVFDRVRP